MKTNRPAIRCVAAAVSFALLLAAPRLHAQEADLGTLNRIVAAGKLSRAPIIRIPPKTYRIASSWDLRGLSNTVLDGQGSLVLYTGTNLGLMPWSLRDGARLTMRHFVFDYEVPPFAQGEVAEVGAGGRTLRLRTHAGYPDFSRTGSFRQMYLFDRQTRGWKRGTADLYPEKVEILSPTEARVTLPTNLAPTFPRHQAGDLWAATMRVSSAFGVYHCEDLVLEKITLRAAPSLAFVIRYQRGGLLVDGCRVERGPLPPGATEARLMSSGADALNVAYLTAGMRVEHCDFGWMGDDSINIHGGVYPILRVEAPDRLVIAKRGDLGALDELLQGGARLRFTQGGSFAPLGDGQGASLAPVPEPRPHDEGEIKAWWPSLSKTRVVEYALRLTNTVLRAKAGDWVEFPDINGDGYVVRDNYFHDHRARCVRIQAGRGLIERNRFERIGHAGLSIGPEYTYWREAGWAWDVVIRSNQFKDIGMQWNLVSPYGYCPGAISLFYKPENASLRPPIGNRRVTIEGNRIDGCTVAGIHVNASEDVLIKGNLLKSCNLEDGSMAGAQYGLSSTHAITVLNSRDVRTEGNRVENPGRYARGEVGPQEK